jgi:AraC family transcriptional regulator
MIEYGLVEENMDWLKRMNKVLEYIEDHLRDEIDGYEIQNISCTSGDLFSRMFSHLTGIPLSEYIRKRRLSDAAMRLSEGNESITEIALDYGYDSPDAFTFAFKKQHGITPSQAKKKNVRLTTYPKLSFQITMKGHESMIYRIVEKEAFQVVGSSIMTTQERNMNLQEIPKFWARIHETKDAQKLCSHAADENMLGICYDGKPDGTFSYMIGVVSNERPEGFEVLTIPKATWAVFESIGPLPKAIQDVWTDIFQNFLPSSDYEHAPLPDFELYPDGDTGSKNYHCEVWIPIQKKSGSSCVSQ